MQLFPVQLQRRFVDARLCFSFAITNGAKSSHVVAGGVGAVRLPLVDRHQNALVA